MKNELPEITYRAARLVDAESIFALIHLHRDRLVPKSLANIVENIDRFIVAEDGATMIGCATYQILPEIGSPIHATVEIQSVAVRLPWRGKMVGRTLVGKILERVSAFRPAEALVLTFSPQFFAHLGFREIPKSQVMHKLYRGCINCTKHADPFTCPEKAMALTLGKEA